MLIVIAGEQLPKFLGENDIVPNASFISSNDAEEEDTVEDMVCRFI